MPKKGVDGRESYACLDRKGFETLVYGGSAGCSRCAFLGFALMSHDEKCHKKIADLRVEVQHIPGGTTGLCQPIDIVIRRSFKNLYEISGRTGWASRLCRQGV